MRNLLLSALACAVVSACQPAVAQGLNLNISTKDPLTNLEADQWSQLVVRIVNPAPIVGKDSVYVVNATGEDLSSVTCRGYFLVGSKPYITSNRTTNAPASLPKWSVTLVPSDGFDSYCTKGIEASGAIANYHGALNAGDKSFSGSTFVVFKKPVN